MTRSSPQVSFVVPCYRLAQYLGECVGSILSQTYPHVDIIVLDDQSPDDTEAVARGIMEAHPDRRISYVRNAKNLGNIRNYNKGIGLASGKYVWILSPDDRLRNSRIVERYVALLESRGDVGFAFCPAHVIRGAKDTGPHAPSLYRLDDAILEEPQLVKDIVDNNFELIAASVMVRKECYERVTLFPTDMPHRGDSYVWALIAMRYATAYFCEPMVDYRIHDMSMMSTFARENMARVVEDDIAVPWRVKAGAEALGQDAVIAHCWDSIVLAYRNALVGVFCRGHAFAFTVPEVEASLERWEPDLDQRARVRNRLARRMYLSSLGELRRGHPRRARKALANSFSLDPALRFRPPIQEILRRIPRLYQRLRVGVLGQFYACTPPGRKRPV
jgi:glycosyltransferase involved in cell wall biosynthesis